MAANALEKQEIDRLFGAAYDELRRLAARIKRQEGRITIDPTGLVNEAWLRLSRSEKVVATSMPHFKRIAAGAMKHVLIDMARERDAKKRRPDDAFFVTVEESVTITRAIATAQDLLHLEAALKELAVAEPRQALIVEWRFFGGLTVEQIAAALEVGKTTVEEEWRSARAWLKRQLRKRRQGGEG